MRVAILGLGLVGGSVGLAARERAGAEVVGYDAEPDAGAQALERGAVDAVAASPAAALEGADAVILAAPVDVLPGLLGDVLAAAAPGCVVSDVGSVKAPVVAAAGGDERFVGGHPLAGAEAAGVAHARADLFAGATWYLTPTARTSGVLYERLHRFVAALGARPTAIEADVHDRHMACVSHVPHVLANVLVGLAAAALPEDGAVPAIGPSFRDTARVAGANPRLWAGIYAANRDALADQLDLAVARLTGARDALRAGDDLRAWQEEAAGDRALLLGDRLVGAEQREVRVAVPNRPGVVADLALTLGRAGINISDMALSPSVDGTQGTVALWIAADEAGHAAELIAGLGFPVT